MALKMLEYEKKAKAPEVSEQEEEPEMRPVIHAHWVKHLDARDCNIEPFFTGQECSHCHFWIDISARFNYCPYCGANMDERV